jgi:hypothetical protein
MDDQRDYAEEAANERLMHEETDHVDPNETLRMIRYYLALLSNECCETHDASWYTDHAYAIDALIEHVTAIDDWLSKGGALPEVWCDVS